MSGIYCCSGASVKRRICGAIRMRVSENLNWITSADQARLHHADANTTASTGQRAGHAGFGDGLDVTAGWARSIVFQRGLADDKLFAREVVEADAACDDVAAMFALGNLDTRLPQDIVQRLALDQRDLTLVHAGIVADTRLRSISQETAIHDGFDLFHRLHHRAALRRDKNSLHNSLHGLPPVMYLTADVFIVDGLDLQHRGVAQVGEGRSERVLFGLAGAFGAGDGAGDGVEHEDPTQCELREGKVIGGESLQYLHGFQSGFVVHTRESFAAVEGFAVTVELAVIVGTEFRLFGHLPGQ